MCSLERNLSFKLTKIEIFDSLTISIVNDSKLTSPEMCSGLGFFKKAFLSILNTEVMEISKFLNMSLVGYSYSKLRYL